MEGASTSKERKKEVRQMEESYTQNVTVKTLLQSATFELKNNNQALNYKSQSNFFSSICADHSPTKKG